MKISVLTLLSAIVLFGITFSSCKARKNESKSKHGDKNGETKIENRNGAVSDPDVAPSDTDVASSDDPAPSDKDTPTSPLLTPEQRREKVKILIKDKVVPDLNEFRLICDEAVRANTPERVPFLMNFD
jgi:hypothetical protein